MQTCVCVCLRYDMVKLYLLLYLGFEFGGAGGGKNFALLWSLNI